MTNEIDGKWINNITYDKTCIYAYIIKASKINIDIKGHRHSRLCTARQTI